MATALRELILSDVFLFLKAQEQCISKLTRLRFGPTTTRVNFSAFLPVISGIYKTELYKGQLGKLYVIFTLFLRVSVENETYIHEIWLTTCRITSNNM